jgi:hypothetical protein
MSLRSVTNSISSIAGIAESTATKLGALSNSGGDNSAIRERYLNGFLGNTPQFVPQVFSRIFDEPTYLTFRIEFDFSNDLIQNNASTSDASGALIGVDAFNYMPEPLLSLNTSGKSYSTYNYLLSALGEQRRAAYIKQFVNSLHDIQYNYPFYFTTIEGLDTLTQINTERGIRLLDGDNNKLIIKCLEGLDQKITQLMQLYRKAAWDDVYQRWILPDMMRFFTMRIYVSEMKLFHTMSKSSNKRKGAFVVDFSSDVSRYARSSDQLSASGNLLGGLNNFLNSAAAISANMLGDGSNITKFLEGANSVTETVDTVLNSIRGDMFLCDNAINDIMPTMCFECHMCEFDIASTLSHLSNLSSSKNGTSAAEPSISIKVGRLVEKMIFPLQNGLLSSEDGYIIGKDLFNSVYINDDYLRKEATVRKEDLLSNNKGIPSYEKDKSISNKMYRVNSVYGGATSSNSAASSTSANNINESYNPFSPDKSTAAVSLFTGLAGVFFTDLKSTAIDGEVAQKTRENLETPIAVSKGAAIMDENRRKLVGSTVIDTSALGDTLSEATDGDTPLNSTIEVENINTLSEATDGDTALTSTIEDTSSFSTATLTTNKIQQIVDENGADAVLSAATALKKTIDYFIDNEEIKSMATSPEQREKVANSLMMSTIEKISLSTATDSNSKALKDLAKVMIEDVEMSIATSKSSADKISRGALIKDPGKSAATAADRKFNTGTDAFSYLNN